MDTQQGNIPTYQGLSIFNMVCCCFPLGLAALIYSCQAENSITAGNVDRATRSARIARILNIVGILLGIIVIIVVVVFVVVGNYK